MSRKSIRLLALDTSSTTTGWALYLNGKLNKHDIIDLSKNNDSEQRLKQMKQQIMAILKKIKPHIVVIEANRNNNNVKTVRMLSSVMGVVEGYCMANDIDYQEFSPTQWRKYVKGNDILPKHRGELKEWSMNKVMNMGIDIQTDDESDAILIGQALINFYDALDM